MKDFKFGTSIQEFLEHQDCLLTKKLDYPDGILQPIAANAHTKTVKYL